ncbi:MAG: respiratory nitrate reductase subunit gamma, partial [Thermoleophilia bacterium]|nr:respiratory nitrate reductase subunit gamma [Thermoleophilia bacterium]
MPVERVHFWGISAVWLFYVVAGLSVAVFLAGVALRVTVWIKGRADRPAVREERPGFATRVKRAAAGVSTLILDGLFGRRIYRGDVWAGVMHLLIMWGFVGLFIGTVLATIDHWFVHFLTGDTYLGYSVCLEVLGLMLAAGLVIAFVRRYVVRISRLESGPQDLWILLLLFLAVVTGFLVEGTRLAAETPAWEGHSFAGLGLAALLPSGTGAEAFYPYIWWIHAVICLGLVAYFPFSKLFHSLAAPVNIYLAPRPERGDSPEEREPGVPEFSLRDLVDFSACTKCGRCNEVCPSTSALEPFSPRDFIAQADRYTRDRFSPPASPLSGQGINLWSRLRHSRPEPVPAADAPRLSPEQIWFCTTCRACLEVCPVYIGAFEPIRRVRIAEVEDGSRVS